MTTPVFIASTAGHSDFSGTITVSFDCGAGSSRNNPALLVMVYGAAAGVPTTITGCTYNGHNMLAGPTGTDPTNGNRPWALFGLFGDANLGTGTAHNIVASLSASDFNNIHAELVAVSYNNVNPAATMTGSAGAQASSQSPSTGNITGGAVGDLAAGIIYFDFHTLTATNGTSLDVAQTSANGGYQYAAMSKAGGASVALTGTISGSGDFWWVAGVNLPASGSAATTITMTGPANGTINVASSNFTIGVDATPITGTVTVTPHTNLTGTFAPTTVALTTGSPSATCTFTATASGTHSITTTNDGGLSNSTPLSYIAASAYTPYNGPSIFQPTVAQ
jgi:hypothetical protein